MANERDIIYLAALLHDIGKFWQRADDLLFKNSRLDVEDTRLFARKGQATHINQNDSPSHQHVFWTYQFLKNKKEIFQKLGIWSEETNSLLNVATFHHRPQSQIQAFVTMADSWASGIDRTEARSEEDFDTFRSDIKWDWKRYKRLPLMNIFGKVRINNIIPTTKESETKVFNLRTLSLKKDAVFGHNLGINPPEITDQYQNLWKAFYQEFDLLPTDSLEVFNQSLHYLLRKYCWAIPASTIDFPDNSLFDHLKITAAIAQSLYDFQQVNPENFEFSGRWKIKKEALPLRLWCIDLSGIQSFIYSIASKYAAKSLKGRSFSLQLLLDDIARLLVTKTNTTLSHIIYSSGGKFFMILPNTISITNGLEEVQQSLQNEIWEKHGSGLFVCFGSVAFAYNQEVKGIQLENESTTKTLGDLWKIVTERAADQKNRKFKHKLLPDFDSLFEASKREKGGDVDVCIVSGEERDDLMIANPEVKSEEQNKVTPAVFQQIKIGEDLKEHQFIISSKASKNLRGERRHQLLGSLLHHSFYEAVSIVSESDICTTVLPELEIEFLKDLDGINNSFSFKFYGGSQSALLTNGNLKTFEDLAGETTNDGNYHRIGFLRMDVDNLGKLFTHGFDKDRASFSAYATLSGMLDWFFSGYLNTIRNQEAYKINSNDEKGVNFKDWVNIIYSGGDDLFAVGRWDKIIIFAHAVRIEFERFTGRKDLTISGGIEIVSPKFPIAKAAELAGGAEDKAKEIKRRTEGIEKDALCLFGIAIGWEEFDEVRILKDKWVEWLKKDQQGKSILSKGLLQKMFSYYEVYQSTDQEGNRTHDLSWKWNAAYNLARQASNTKNEDKKEALHELKNILFTKINNNSLRFEAFIVACRWAELELKDV